MTSINQRVHQLLKGLPTRKLALCSLPAFATCAFMVATYLLPVFAILVLAGSTAWVYRKRIPSMFENDVVTPSPRLITLEGRLSPGPDQEVVRTMAYNISKNRHYATDLENWVAAEKAHQEMRAEELRAAEQIIRSMIEHENTLMHNRIQWFLTITGFLITSVFLAGGYVASGFPVALVSIVGFLVSLSFWLSLRVGGVAVKRLSALWDRYRDKSVPNFSEIGVLGSRLKEPWTWLAPWSILPFILAIFWIAIFSVTLLLPTIIWQSPSGTYVHLEPSKPSANSSGQPNPCKNKIVLLHTGTGNIKCITPPPNSQ